MSSSSDIKLIDLLTKIQKNDPKNGILRDIYKRHGKNTPEDVVDEICKDGSNTIGRILSGPVSYDEVVRRANAKITQDIYIRKGNGHGETGYSYTRNWNQKGQGKE